MLQARNKPCHCGSGKPYKKCHGAFTAEFCFKANDSSTALQELEKLLRARKLFEARHGDVKPMLTESMEDRRFVAIGDTYQISPNCKTFTDFLTRYLIDSLDSTYNWGEKQTKLPPREQHPIVQWLSLMRLGMETTLPDERGLHEITLGAANAWFHLAYDLYLIKHNAELQTKLLRRLRDRENFQGARFESVVAAIMLASGYDLQFANLKGDGTHPEFVATHRDTQRKLAVEAKSRHRPGILGFKPHEPAQPPESYGIEGLLRDAVNKNTEDPLLVFIEVNAPEMIRRSICETSGELGGSWAKVQAREWKDGFPAIGVVFYNDIAPWGLKEPLPRESHSCCAIASSPGVSRHSFDSSSLLERIVQGYTQRSTIPTEFPK